MYLKSTLPLMLMSVFAGNVAAAEAICRPLSGSAEGLEIGEIRIVNKDIFDAQNPDEDSAVHMMANKLHIQTRSSVIEAQLLFASGQPFNQRLLDESERRLRSKKFIHTADIDAAQVCDNKVVVVVSTTDNWTLTPSISLGRSGGINRIAYEISESNLFGYGKDITLKSTSDEDRDSRLFHYQDDNLFGSQYVVDFITAKNSDGFLDTVSFGKPFYQLDSTDALWLELHNEEKQTTSYINGKIVGITGEAIEQFSVEKGWSEGLVNDRVLRYKLGIQSLKNDYFNVANYPATALPDGSVKQFPYVGLEYFENRFIKRENFNVMGVVEDIAIGNHFSARLGMLNQSWGSTYDGLLFEADYSLGLDLSEDTLAFIDAGVSSEMNRDAEDYNALNLAASWAHYQDHNHSYYVQAEYQVADNLLPTERYVIGGETGLRGYPIRYQSGTSKALFSVEKRTYFNWYPWKIMKFGVAIFADVGSAWERDESPDFIRDVGFGLRLVSTRQSDAKVLHLDFAYPLDEKDQVDGFQLLLSAKSRF